MAPVHPQGRTFGRSHPPCRNPLPARLLAGHRTASRGARPSRLQCAALGAWCAPACTPILPARTVCRAAATCQLDSGSLCATRRARLCQPAPVQPACESSEWRSAWQYAARPSLPPPIMARHSVFRHLHTHDAHSKAHSADASHPDPLRRCEQNAHAMPIDSDTSVLMAADFQGINARRLAPRGAPARARTRTVPCSCTRRPLPCALRARASTPSLH